MSAETIESTIGFFYASLTFCDLPLPPSQWGVHLEDGGGLSRFQILDPKGLRYTAGQADAVLAQDWGDMAS